MCFKQKINGPALLLATGPFCLNLKTDNSQGLRRAHVFFFITSRKTYDVDCVPVPSTTKR